MTPILKELKKGKIPLCWLFRKYGKKIPKWLEWLIGDPATIFTDNFNSYTDGDLAGQGSWINHYNGLAFDIQGTTVKEGAKAVKIYGHDTDQYVKKTGTLLAAGKTTIYIRKNDVGAMRIALAEAATGIKVYLRYYTDENIQYYTTAWNNIGVYAIDTWHCIEIEWQSTPSQQVRCRVDGGTWTDWLSPYATWTDGLDTIYLGTEAADGGGATGDGYFDYIAENPLPITYYQTLAVTEVSILSLLKIMTWRNCYQLLKVVLFLCPR